MIEANELKYGNFIESNNVFRKVKWICPGNTGDTDGKEYDILFENDFGCLLEDCNPIQLTPEILINAGFVHDTTIQQGISYVLDITARRKIVYCDGDASCLSLYQDGELIDFPAGISKHVHQLQNLHFALTQKELTIQL